MAENSADNSENSADNSKTISDNVDAVVEPATIPVPEPDGAGSGGGDKDKGVKRKAGRPAGAKDKEKRATPKRRPRIIVEPRSDSAPSAAGVDSVNPEQKTRAPTVDPISEPPPPPPPSPRSIIRHAHGIIQSQELLHAQARKDKMREQYRLR